jgi:hypothetical protein
MLGPDVVLEPFLHPHLRQVVRQMLRRHAPQPVVEPGLHPLVVIVDALNVIDHPVWRRARAPGIGRRHRLHLDPELFADLLVNARSVRAQQRVGSQRLLDRVEGLVLAQDRQHPVGYVRAPAGLHHQNDDRLGLLRLPLDRLHARAAALASRPP